ncbi:glutamate 5-kinase [Rickettsiales bacterium]|nr:glutamate 5-kinase [Rickettsiales bacterium]
MIAEIKNKKRIIIKIGSNILIENNNIRTSWLESLAHDILYLRSLNKEVILVSSGAIALGRGLIKTKNKLSLEEKQAACSIGQIDLIANYKAIFEKHNLNIAQILLTSYDSSHRQSYLNAKNTINTLIKNEIIPIINENDTVATEEISIGDNDRLAARVAQMIDADLLILLSDIDGLYDKNPNLNKDAKFIDLIENIDENIKNMASGSISDIGSGGMTTKIKAAKMAFNCGCDTIITNGSQENSISNLLNGGRFSLFKSNQKKIKSKKRWILDDFRAKGELIVNKNAVVALKNGSSLLAVGVQMVVGKFEEGDHILIKDINNKHIATGIASYSSTNIKIIMGKNTNQIKEVFGLNIKEELVHRDNMVVV